MIRVKVISEFYDKYNLKRLFDKGEVIEVDEDRAADLIARQLVESVKAEQPKLPIAESKPRRGKR